MILRRSVLGSACLSESRPDRGSRRRQFRYIVTRGKRSTRLDDSAMASSKWSVARDRRSEIRREQQTEFELRLPSVIRYARSQRGNVFLDREEAARADSGPISQLRPIAEAAAQPAWDGRIAESFAPVVDRQ